MVLQGKIEFNLYVGIIQGIGPSRIRDTKGQCSPNPPPALFCERCPLHLFFLLLWSPHPNPHLKLFCKSPSYAFPTALSGINPSSPLRRKLLSLAIYSTWKLKSNSSMTHISVEVLHSFHGTQRNILAPWRKCNERIVSQLVRDVPPVK